ncbi:MAG: hypothetical protein MUF52_01335 [Syntrophobacteraceae bacterium]|jgi:hypothetical protein|nr:hypothetical protein [Syntrophobacteraceae bacterium]
MKRRTIGLLALVVALMWVLASAVPSDARRSYHNGHRHWGHRSYVTGSFHAPFYAPFRGSYYYRPYYYRPYHRTYHYRPYYYGPYYGYPYYGTPVAYGWPFFWPGMSFYFRF